MKKVYVMAIIVVLISVMVTSCGTLFTKGGSDYRSGVAAYEKQEYVTSLRYLSQSLSANPEFVEAQQLFPKVFTEGTAYYKRQVSDHEKAQDRQSADRVFHAYTRLQELHEVAQTSGVKGLAIEDHAKQLQAAALVSGDLWFSYAESLRKKGDRESLKQAVVAYETARGRNPDIQNIDSVIADVIADATISLAVVAFGSGVEGFPQMVLEDVTEVFAGNRFVEVVQRHDFAPGEDSMVGPTDIALMVSSGEGWDYVLEVYAHQSFSEINKETAVTLPSQEPLFPGVKKTIGYQHTTDIYYRLFDVNHNFSIVLEDHVREVDGPHEYTFSYVNAEGLRELNLGGTGKKNLRYITSHASDMVTDSAIGTLRWDYESIDIPLEVPDPTNQTQWIPYFANRYSDFDSFAASESGRELFYGIEVVHHRPSDTYFMVGPSLDDAIRRSKINSAIMNALSYTARTFVEQEKENGGYTYRKAGKLAAQAIADIL